jgi:N-acetyltransferase
VNFDPQPRLAGPTLTLRPLRADDFEPLYAVASDALIWALHPDPSRAERAGFERFFADSLSSGGALIVTANQPGHGDTGPGDAGAIIGTSRFYDFDPVNRELAIGYTFLARSHWGGEANHEMKRLMIDHAFGWVDTLWFHVGKYNLRSRRAMEKIGAKISHEGERPQNGVMIPFLYYRIDASHWRAR